MNGFEEISKLGEGAYSIVLKVRRKADNNIYIEICYLHNWIY